MAGATTGTLTLTTVPLACSGMGVSAVASNGVAPDAVSAATTLTVHPVPVPPLITAQPAAQAVLTYATATFSVTATGPALSYQWKKNGTNIVGATSSTYTTPAVSWVDNGASYTVGGEQLRWRGAEQRGIADAGRKRRRAGVVQLLGASGSYQIVWNLNDLGAQVSGTHSRAMTRR